VLVVEVKARAVRLAATERLDLGSFDQAVLAAVLVRAEELRSEAGSEFAFCKLDSDLQPWDKDGRRKETFADLYDAAGVWVYAGFVMNIPRRPERSAGAGYPLPRPSEHQMQPELEEPRAPDGVLDNTQAALGWN
jgi:hypothetical protein